MARRTYQFDIIASITQAVQAVDNLTQITESKLGNISFASTVSAFRDGFDLITGAANTAFNAIEGFAAKAIDEANDAEAANLALANSLRLAGDFSEDALSSFDNLADSIASVSTFTDDSVKASLALAKQFRLTNKEAENAVRVAADLAAIQGTTLDEATRKVSQTFNGFVDKSLAKTIPGLKNLSKESLVAGEAIALIQERVQGSAEALGNTFAGAVFRAEEAANDIFETFGTFITQNPAIIAGVNEIAKGFREFNEVLESQGDSLRALVTDGFLFLVDSAPLVVRAVRGIDNAFATLSASFKSFILLSTNLPNALLQAVTGSSGALKDLQQRLLDIDDAVQFSDRDQRFYDPLIKSAEDLADRVRKAAQAAEDSRKSFQNLGESNTGQQQRAQDLFSPEDLRKNISEVAKEPLKFAFEAAVSARAITDKEGAAIGVGIVNNVLKGAAGAQKLLTETIGAAADLVLPGIGGAVSEIVGILSQGPEATKKAVQEFAQAIPTLIQALAESLPVLIETLTRELPPALAKTFPTIAIGFTQELIKNIPSIISGFTQGLIDGAKAFVESIIDQITSFGGLFGGGGGGGGGLSDIPIIGDVLGGIGDIFGFAQGGRIPELPQFRNDGAIIRADAGEQIFSRDLTQRMERYLDQNEGGGQTYVGTLVLQMGLDEFARISFEADRRGLRTRVV